MTAHQSADLTAPAPVAPGPHGAGTGTADLWCTYAAVRTLRWLDALPTGTAAHSTAQVLRSRRNTDGGYAWSRGMSSDAWATFYCTQALRDLDVPIEHTDRTADWLQSTWTGHAYGMQPGQHADVWATHYSVRTLNDVCARPVPDTAALTNWLAALQTPDGGLTWTPEHARDRSADVRACFYGVLAHAHSGAPQPAPPWDVDRLVSWLQSMQGPEGGFRLNPEADTCCMWATYRALGALHTLGADAADPQTCRRWILRQRHRDGAFVRWPGYDQTDVWASFCAVGSLRFLNPPHGAVPDDVAEAVSARLAEMATAGGGYTYVDPAAAGDTLTTAAALLSNPSRGDAPLLRRWLEGCQLPNEDGVMYMPGRGSEMRCTQWALAAGAFNDDPAARAAIADWVAALQNPDGGFGYWEGRGSDIISTSAALDILTFTDTAPADALDIGALHSFLSACQCGGSSGGDVYSNVPGAEGGLRASLQVARIRAHLGADVRPAARALLDRHAVRGGGWADQGHRVPDLLSTYEAALTSDQLGLPRDDAKLRALLDRLRSTEGTSWTPLAPGSGGPLADCLGALLSQSLRGERTSLPPLTLS